MPSVALWGLAGLLCLTACRTVIVDVGPADSGARDASTDAESVADTRLEADAKPFCATGKTIVESTLVCWVCADEKQVVVSKICRVITPDMPAPGGPQKCSPEEEPDRICKVCVDQRGTVVEMYCERR